MRFVVTSPATFGAGTQLGLADVQAAPRAHALRALGDGWYEALAPAQFKAGEVIELRVAPPTAMAQQLADADAADAPAAAAVFKRRRAKG